MSNSPLIAIVDDDRAVREALCDLLLVEGHRACPFASGDSFLAADPARVDCVITDVRMPGIDGLELQRQLRQRGLALPVIFLTSLGDEAARARALRDGASAWLTKPACDEALLAAICAALKAAG